MYIATIIQGEFEPFENFVKKNNYEYRLSYFSARGFSCWFIYDIEVHNFVNFLPCSYSDFVIES